jgi:O-antigen ligase
LYGNYLLLNMFLLLAAGSLLAEDRDGRMTGAPAALRRHAGLMVLGGLLAFVLGIFSTGSRGALVAMGAGLLVSVPRVPRRLRVKQLVAVPIALACVGAAIAWYFRHHPYLLVRLHRTGATDHNVTERLTLWRAARDAFYAHPLLGIGYGQFQVLERATHGAVAKVSHETYLSYAAELGLPGLLAFLALLLTVMRDAFVTRLAVGSRVARYMFGFLVASAVQALFNNVDQFRSLWIAFGVVAALVAYSARGRGAASTPLASGVLRR